MEEDSDYSYASGQNLAGITGDDNIEPSQLIILKQNSSAIENISKNGIQKAVHIVVKNQPFLIQVGLASAMTLDGQPFDLTRFPLEARLLYDNESLKEVDFVKLKPMEVKFHVTERGDQASAEIRVKVLTSQLEDMLFRVRFYVTHPITKARLENFCAITQPIRVVSKPEQVKKKTDRSAANSKRKSTPKETPLFSNPDIMKVDPEETLKEALDRVENACLAQRQMLQELHEQNEAQRATILQLLSNTNTANSNAKREENEKEKEKEKEKKRKVAEEADSPFDIAFKQFMASYNHIEQNERPAKVHRVMNKSQKKANEFRNFLEECQTASQHCRSEGKKQKFSPSEPSCACEECPHKRELERIDKFYNEFLFTSEATAMPL